MERAIKQLQDSFAVMAAMEQKQTERLMRHEQDLNEIAQAWLKLEQFRIRTNLEIAEFRRRTEQNLVEITDKLTGLIGHIGGPNLGVTQ